MNVRVGERRSWSLLYIGLWSEHMVPMNVVQKAQQNNLIENYLSWY